MTDTEIIKWLDSQLTAKSGYLLIRLDNGHINAQTAEIATLRHALRKSAAVLAGLEMNKSALVHALELARDALTQQEQSC